ncbi:MAG: hypothetical protein ABSH03_19755 [Candidatus Lustribacter sp.]
MAIDKVGKTSSSPAPAISKAPAPAAPSSGPGSFSSAADELTQALQYEQELTSGYRGPSNDPKKAALESIDDIAARASLNIVERKGKQPTPNQS